MIRADFAAFVITYNRPGILLHTISELCKQTVTPAKIIIVNNGEKLDLDALRCSEEVDLEEHLMGFNSGPADTDFIRRWVFAPNLRNKELHVHVPHWFLITLVIIAASATWVFGKWHFSLRTLLIAATLVAVILPLIIWLSR